MRTTRIVGAFAGIAIAGPTRDEDPQAERELYAIYVREAHQGTGMADLQQALADRIQKMRFERERNVYEEAKFYKITISC